MGLLDVFLDGAWFLLVVVVDIVDLLDCFVALFELFVGLLMFDALFGFGG